MVRYMGIAQQLPLPLMVLFHHQQHTHQRIVVVE
jgi:hypothetical protein